MTLVWADLSKTEQAAVKRAEDAEKRFARQDANEARQRELQPFIDLHGLSCFSCGSSFNDWAKTGMTKFGKPYAICTWCVRTKKGDPRKGTA